MIALLVLGCTDTPSEPLAEAPSAEAVNHTIVPATTMREGLKAEPTYELLGTPAAEPHSIVIISLDTVRADRLGVYGGRAKTPVMSAFAAQGTRFEQAISHFPETALSHWSMLSGVLPEVHGNVPANGGSRYSGPTLAEIATRSGYATAAIIGGITMTDQASGLSRGFATYDDDFAVDEADMRRPGADVSAEAAAWIQQQSGPYFAFVHYFDAHFPYTPAPPWDTAYDPHYTGTLTGTDADLRGYRDGGQTPSDVDLAHVLALYDGELSELDALLAPVIEAAGSDTIVVITADHGESFEHDYYFNHRAGLWDGVVRVPWLIRGPGVTAGEVFTDQVGLVDVTPTVLALAGLPLDARMQGSALLTGDAAGSPAVWSITDPWVPEPQFAQRTASEKCIDQDGTVLRYDLLTDPAESKNLGGEPCTRDTYDTLIADMAQYQVPEPDNQIVRTDEECARLEALGYTTCSDAASGPPGPPPNNGQPIAPSNGQPNGQSNGQPNAPSQAEPPNKRTPANSNQNPANSGQRPPGLPPGTPPPQNPGNK